MNKLRGLLFILILPCFCFAQKQGSVWCFGDSALVDFSDTANISTGLSRVKSRGSCASISDSSGNLLFYVANGPDPGITGNVHAGKVYNKLHNLMLNGDSLNSIGWYHEIVIVPFLLHDSLFFVFTAGTYPTFFGVYYSIVNLNKNGGAGEVVQKNIQVFSGRQADCISAIKHGNGRDWWIMGRKSAVVQITNEYWKCLVTPSGVSIPTFQNIGSLHKSDFSEITFSLTGDTMLFTNAGDLIEYYNFDRCTGVLSNPVTIRPPATTYSEWTWDNEFSPDGRYIYTSTSKDTTQLFQYDLQSPNPLATRVTLYQSTFPSYCGGALKRAPDGKIYFSIAYENVVAAYPYPDSIYNMYNMNLSVINSPDSPGAACNFQPYSFYLGGKRTYWGLPNNPDYMLGPKAGSVCDTLSVGVNSPPTPKGGVELFPNPNDGLFSVNYFLPNGKKGVLEIYNAQGEIIYKMQLPRYTYMQEINLKTQAKGIYLLKIMSGGVFVTKKFIKR